MKRLYLHDSDRQPELLLPLQITSTPILLEHCQDDGIVAIQNGMRLRDFLGQLGLSVEWHGYEDGGHWVNEPRGADEFVNFLRKHMDGTTT